jgi:hypothetical protein
MALVHQSYRKLTRALLISSKRTPTCGVDCKGSHTDRTWLRLALRPRPRGLTACSDSRLYLRLL